MTQSDTNYAAVRRTAEAGQDGVDGAGAPNPLLLVHSLLRGRYILAAVLSLLGAAGGGVAGYYATQPTYQSVGMIRIKPTVPTSPLIGQDRVMPAFELFVKSQIAFIQGERVISRAMERPEWQAVRPGMSPDAIVSFRSKLEVAYDRGELVKVMFTDADPAVAMRGARAVTSSYIELYANSESEDGAQRLEVLQKLRTQYANTLRSKNSAIAVYAGSDIDPEALEKLYFHSVQGMTSRKRDWNDAQRALASAGVAQMPAPDVTTTQPAVPVELTPREIARTDMGMRQLLSEQRNAEKNLTLARTKYGSAHRSVAEAEQQLAFIDEDVKEYADTYRRDAAMRTGGTVVPRTQEEMVLQTLVTREKQLRELYEKSVAESSSLGQKGSHCDHAPV
jgi:hypothetical protein